MLKYTLMIFLFVLFLYLFYQYESQKPNFNEKQLFMLVIHVIGLYCTINVISVILKPTFVNEMGTTFSLIGIHMKKLIFPLYPDTHNNSIGSLGGYLLVLSIGYIKHIKNLPFYNKLVLFFYIGIGVIMIFIGDSRGTLFGTFLSIAIMLVLVSFRKLQVLKYTVWILPFSHVIFIAILQILAGTSAASELSRGSGSDIATGNSRKFIYMGADQVLANFDPIQLIGYGEYGIKGSGVTRSFMEKFLVESEEEALIVSIAHNTALQVLFDIGYIGLFAFLFIIYFSFSQSQQLYYQGEKHFIAISYFFVYHNIIGISESVFGLYYQFVNYLFIFFAFVVFISYNKGLLPKRKQKEYEYAQTTA